jgi:hypothetical protein
VGIILHKYPSVACMAVMDFEALPGETEVRNTVYMYRCTEKLKSPEIWCGFKSLGNKFHIDLHY